MHHATKPSVGCAVIVVDFADPLFFSVLTNQPDIDTGSFPRVTFGQIILPRGKHVSLLASSPASTLVSVTLAAESRHGAVVGFSSLPVCQGFDRCVVLISVFHERYRAIYVGFLFSFFSF